MSTLVPEVFLDPRENREAVKTSREAARREKSLEMNLTFMQTPRSGSDLRLGLVDIFTNTQINIIGSFDW